MSISRVEKDMEGNIITNTEEEQKILDAIEDVPLDKIDEFEAEYIARMNGTTPETPVVKSEDDDDKVEKQPAAKPEAVNPDAPKQPETEKPKDDKLEPPPAEPVVEEPKQPDSTQPKVETVTITDDYIDRASEEDKQILRGIRGEQMTPKVLKNYINGQRKINSDKIAREHENPPQPKPVEEQQQIAQLKSSLALQKLKTEMKNPDIPETVEEYDKYLADLMYENPREAMKMMRVFDTVNEQVDKQYETVENARRNYGDINLQRTNLAVAQIETTMEKWGINLKDFGIDLSLNESKENPVLNKLMFDENGNPDRSIVQFNEGTLLEGVPIINPNALVQKFVVENLQSIMHQVRTKAREEGFKSASEKRSEIPRTLNDSTVGATGIKKELTAADIDAMSWKDIEALEKTGF